MCPHLARLTDVVWEETRITLGEPEPFVVGEPGLEGEPGPQAFGTVNAATGDSCAAVIKEEAMLTESTGQIQGMGFALFLKTTRAPLQLDVDASSVGWLWKKAPS